ncbi:MAG: NosD domain-containing protein, partial [Promethearchaeota archaeon]
MGPKFRANIIFIGITGIIIFLSIISFINPYFEVIIDENIKSSDSASSGFIHIDNNWTEAEIMGICEGEGTYSNPYVIQDLLINGSGFEACILIENTHEYFRIENCSVFNSEEPSFGINLYNVNNSQIVNNTYSTYEYGICLFNCNNNTISVNMMNNETYSDGIYLSESNNNLISKNIVNNSGNSGIILSQSDNNVITENNVSFNNHYGIKLY